MDRGEELMEALWNLLRQRWALDGAVWKQAGESLNLTELRCVAYVGGHTNANSTRLAQVFFMTTGAASKLTKRLMTKGLLERFQRPDNRKAVYFRLTEEGKALYAVLTRLQEELRVRDAPVFQRMTDGEYEAIAGFIRRYEDHLSRVTKGKSLSDAGV